MADSETASPDRHEAVQEIDNGHREAAAGSRSGLAESDAGLLFDSVISAFWPVIFAMSAAAAASTDLAVSGDGGLLMPNASIP